MFIGCWELFVVCGVCVVRCVFVWCVLFVVCCLFIVECCGVFVVCCLVVSRWSLFGVCCV